MKHCVSLAALAEYIGQRPAGLLSQHLGGTSIKIPKRAAGTTWDRLVAIMGEASAQTLVEYFGGEGLYVARNHRAALNARREEVARLRAQGMSFTQIASKIAYTQTYTERGVRRLACADRSGTRTGAQELGGHPQQSLFDAPAPHPLMAMFGGTHSRSAPTAADTIPTDANPAHGAP